EGLVFEMDWAPCLSFFTDNGHYAFIASMATACLVEVAGTVVVLRLLHASTRAWKRRALTGSVVYVSSGWPWMPRTKRWLGTSRSSAIPSSARPLMKTPLPGTLTA